jgi:hypothetical protein
MEVLGLSALTTREAAPGIHFVGGWVDPRTGLDVVVKRKILHLPGLEPRSSLYRLGCPDYYLELVLDAN